MAIKINIGKLHLNKPLEVFVNDFIQDYSCTVLDITLPHIYYTQQLPYYHRDPFDRLLVSQSLAERIPLISADPVFKEYGVVNLWDE